MSFIIFKIDMKCKYTLKELRLAEWWKTGMGRLPGYTVGMGRKTLKFRGCLLAQCWHAVPAIQAYQWHVVPARPQVNRTNFSSCFLVLTQPISIVFLNLILDLDTQYIYIRIYSNTTVKSTWFTQELINLIVNLRTQIKNINLLLSRMNSMLKLT